MKSLSRYFLPLMLVCFATSVMAHPGHGEPGPMHYVTSMDHVAIIGGSAVLILAGFAWAGKRRFNSQRS
ncbi:MAG: hypothetical protein AB8B91_13315 [Rubripirellula sp.]